jgi:hypothetical protein
MTCKSTGPAPYLIFVNSQEIRRLAIDNSRYDLLVHGLHSAAALDYHLTQNLVFWSDIGIQAVSKATLNGDHSQAFVIGGLKIPSGLAVDWIHNLLYIVDAGAKRIEVSSLNGAFRRSVIWRGLDKPRGIAIHPGLGRVFWTDYGHQAKICSAYEDGSDVKILVSEEIERPNGLTIDYAIDTIYWAGASPCIIESMKLDGTDRRKLIDCRSHHPFALTAFEDIFYWTDWKSQSIFSVSRVGRVPHIIHKGLALPMDIHA